MSKINLTSAMRANLLSLQNTSKLQSLTQQRLATGLKVNSPIDNANSFYTAASLSTRARDLTALLDSMGQSIQTLKTANTALEAQEKLLRQLEVVANAATSASPSAPKNIYTKDWFANQSGVSAVVTTLDELKAAINSGVEGNIVVYGRIKSTEEIVLKQGQNLVGVGYFSDIDSGVKDSNLCKFSGIDFTFLGGVAKSGVVMSYDGQMISDMSISVVTDARGGKGAIFINAPSGAAKTVTVRNCEVSVDTSQDKAGTTWNGNVFAGINSTNTNYNRAKVNLEGIVNIYQADLDKDGRYSCRTAGICNVTATAAENSTVNMMNQDSYWSSNLWQANFNVADNAAVNIYNKGSEGYDTELGSANPITLMGAGSVLNLYAESGNYFSGGSVIKKVAGATINTEYARYVATDNAQGSTSGSGSSLTVGNFSKNSSYSVLNNPAFVQTFKDMENAEAFAVYGSKFPADPDRFSPDTRGLNKSWFASQAGVSAVVTSQNELKAAINSGQTGNIVIYGNIKITEELTLGAGQNLVGVGYFAGVNNNARDSEIDKFSRLEFDMGTQGTSGIVINNNGSVVSDLSMHAISGNRNNKALIDISPSVTSIDLSNLHLSADTTASVDSPATDKFSLVISRNNNTALNWSGKNNLADKSSNSTANNFYGLNGGVHNMASNSSINAFSPNPNTAATSYLLSVNQVNVGANASLNLKGPVGTGTQRINLMTSTSVLKTNFVGNASFSVNFGAAGAKYENKNGTYSANKQKGFSTITDSLTAAVTDLTRDANIKTSTDTDFQSKMNNMMYSVNYNVAADVGKYKDTSFVAPDPDDPDNPAFDYSHYIKQYNLLLNQLNYLAADAGYRGTNLLMLDDMTVRFSDKASSMLEIKGVDSTTTGLGLTTANWENIDDVLVSIDQISQAIGKIRYYSSNFGSYYSIVTAREAFTEQMANILQEGADKLVLADMNEEAANMISLQTRQLLSTNALALAAEAQRAVLKLFH